MEVKRVPGPAMKGLEIIVKGFTDNKVAKIGWLDGSSYINGTKVAYVAAIQEFGSPVNNIPPRSFIRPTIAEKTPAWNKFFEQGAKAILAGNETPYTVLEKIGLRAAGDVRATIARGRPEWPPLKESTVQARANRYANRTITGSLYKQLVDTGFMLGTLTNSVEEE